MRRSPLEQGSLSAKTFRWRPRMTSTSTRPTPSSTDPESPEPSAGLPWRSQAVLWTIAALLTAVVIAVPLTTESVVAEDREGGSADQVADFMRAKLAHSSAVLEGLAVEDYEMMAKAAQDLALASQASSWQVLQTEEYARQSGDFRRSCLTLRDAAKAKNLDAAALAWVDVTLKCVQCHRYVRDTR